MYGQSVETSEGSALCKKPTVFMTNSAHIAQSIELRCDNSHTHKVLLNGTARQAAAYPVKYAGAREIVF